MIMLSEINSVHDLITLRNKTRSSKYNYGSMDDTTQIVNQFSKDSHDFFHATFKREYYGIYEKETISTDSMT